MPKRRQGTAPPAFYFKDANDAEDSDGDHDDHESQEEAIPDGGRQEDSMDEDEEEDVEEEEDDRTRTTPMSRRGLGPRVRNTLDPSSTGAPGEHAAGGAAGSVPWESPSAEQVADCL